MDLIWLVIFIPLIALPIVVYFFRDDTPLSGDPNGPY